MQNTIYWLDLAKRVMQLHWVDWETGEIHRKQVRRGKLLECQLASKFEQDARQISNSTEHLASWSICGSFCCLSN